MTKLNCSVNSCAYWCDHLCSKEEIQVDGSFAEKENETCCSSFVPRHGMEVSNSTASASEEMKIQCEATNCLHNQQQECDASHVDIQGSRACTCGETKCSSFCCK